MYLKVCALPRRLLTRHPLPLRFIPYCTSLKTSDTTEENGKLYDLSTYELPYSEKEKLLIIETINNASPEDFTRLKVTKGVIKKLLKSKSQVGSYQDVSQLLFIDGMGIKAVENLCKLVLKNGKIEKSGNDLCEDDFENVVYKKRLVKPRLDPLLIKTFQTMVSLHVTAGFLAWTKFDYSGKILDLYIEELLNSDSRFDTPKIYERVTEAVMTIPPADIYVWEERSNYGHLQKAALGTIIISLQLAQIKGMMTALLASRREESEGSRLVYLREVLVPKLFNLKVGEERISGLKLADKLMEGEQVMDWLLPLPLEDDVQELYFSIESNYRRYVATSLFVGIAFHQAVLQHNNKALMILCR
ncbi:transcription elongation factor, mitochondrial-like isoform X1 [Homarus americanus]|uniref:transcription elongation factor, mitochondrial-like isoform X1 n=1 Tax=Homarus americanus TaxID=6706 RepID=UPI001C43C6BA|nr:transcription elongation factor, mitochondrial-like isoform X1 [Homarus americanus]